VHRSSLSSNGGQRFRGSAAPTGNPPSDTFYGFGEPQRHKTQFTYDVDHPLAFAAEDNGATPVEYVLVALGGCLTAVSHRSPNSATSSCGRCAQLPRPNTTCTESSVRTDVRNGFSGVRVS
jgi:hypothetical protein